MKCITGTLPEGYNAINTTKIDENIPANLNLSLGKKASKTVDFGISNSFGFGGHCTALLMKKYIP